MSESKNTIAVFKNANKTKDKQPDFNAVVTINGTETKFALWNSTSKKGLSYLGGVESKPQPNGESQQSSQEGDDFPF